MDGMIVKDFRGKHVHSVGKQCQMGRWGRRRMRAKLLVRVIDGKVLLSMNYSPSELMKDLELELRIRMTYMQAWQAREYVRLLVMGGRRISIRCCHGCVLRLLERTLIQEHSVR